jgi:response regulator RpfG family c-di-GMP phosphodiesterase
MKSRQHNILIVDDELVVRKILNQRLSAEGYHCEEAGSAREALVKLADYPAELVVLDVKMPEKSGAELLPEIKNVYPDTAVIMATAIADTETAIKCMREGAYDYLVKPFNLDEVAISAQRALEKRELVLENRDYQQHLEQRVEEQASKIRTSFLNAITALAYALEAKDEYTSGHSQRVAEISVAIAGELNMPPDDINKIRLAGSVHDIGKIGVRGSVLNKPDKLTDSEFDEIKRHCEIGEHILGPVIDSQEVLKTVRHHHERYDGTGYPDGLKGKQIPLGARILAIADTYDAMTSERPYRTAMSTEIACAEIEHCKGAQFDPAVTDVFLKVVNKKSELLAFIKSETYAISNSVVVEYH